MIDLSFFYSGKMAVVFILMLSSATLEAQRNEKDKFFDLMTAIGEDFGGEFNEAEKALKLDLNGANSFLDELQIFATSEIIIKNENGKFECKKSKKSDFKMAIKTILKPNKKVEDWLKELSVKFSEEKLFNLLFSFAARLEALVHGKKSNEMLKEKQKNPKDKIQTFLAVPKCFPERELRIFDYWIEIIKMETDKSQKSSFVVAIYKEKYDKFKSEDSKEEAFAFSRENYEILKQLNDQKFSIFETSNLLRATFNQAYTTYNYGDEETNRKYAAQTGKQKHILRGKIPQIFVNLLNQINSVFYFYGEISDNFDKNKKCEYAMFFQNISESLMKMMSDKGIDPELHLDSQDFKIQEKVQKDVEENCKKFDNKEAKLIFLNNVQYELAINFELNQQKDVYDRVDDLLSKWVGDNSLIYMHGIYPLSEESYLKKNASKMVRKIEHFTKNTNRETISIIEALIGKEFNLVSLFDEMKWLVEVAIPKEEAKLRKAQKERKSIEGIWGGIEEYYLEIPRMQLTEKARTLAKTFEKILQNVKEHYAQKMDASNVGGDMIMSE